MSIDKEKKSNRLLASRRYTHDSFTDAQESFTNVLDLQASEIYTQANKIPSSGLPFSGSSQIGSYHTDGGDNILRYWWRHKLTKSNLNNEVWFFLNPTGSSDGIGAQLIDDNQQTSFISPKYSVSSLANATTEDSTPGYLAKVFVSSAATSASVSDSDVISVNNYTFDYKTGVVQFTDGTVDPSDSQYVYMSVYQYVGKTLAEGIELTGDISGSASSTGSFGHLVVQGNITASGTVRADAFESLTAGESIDFGDSLNLSGNITASGDIKASKGYFTDSAGIYADKIRRYSDSSTTTKIVLNDEVLTLHAGHASDEVIKVQSGKVTVDGDVSASLDSTGSFGTLETADGITANGQVNINTSFAQLRLSDDNFNDYLRIGQSGPVGYIKTSDDNNNFKFRRGSDNKDLLSIYFGDERLHFSGSGGLDVTGNITGSGNLKIAGNISSSGNIFGTNLLADSASFSTRITTAEGELENTLISASKQLDEQISGSFTAPSSSFSTRITNLVADSASFSTRITITENELENTLISASKQLDEQISGSFGAPSASFSTRITNLKIDSGSISTRLSAVEAGSTSKTLVSSSAQIADEISGSFTSTSASISIRLSDVEAGSTSKTLVSSSAQIADEISGSFTSTSASISERLSSVEAGSTSKTLVSSSAQIADEISGSFTRDSGSFSDRITNFTTGNVELVSGSATSTGSFGRVMTTNLFTSGDSTLNDKVTIKDDSSNAVLEFRSTGGSRINEIQNFNPTQIYNSLFMNANFGVIAQDGTYSGGNNRAAIFSIGHIDGTLYHQFGNANLVAKQTEMGIIDYENISGSLVSTGSFGYLTVAGLSNPNLIDFSSSLSTRITNDSSSFSNRTTILEGSGEIQSLGTTDNVLFANITASGDVVVQGKLTAQEIHTEIESSSIIFTSGSTKFGDTSDDIHEFTGSILVKGNLTAENLTADSSSFSSRITVVEATSASFSTRITTAEQELENTIISASAQLSDQISGSFTAPSASFSNRITADSSSFSTRTTTLEAASASFSTRITTAEQELENTIISASEQLSDQISGSFTAPSASFSTRITNLKIDSGSFSLRNTNLETTSSALINNFDQVQSVGKTDSVDFNNVTTTGNVSGSVVSTGSFGMIKEGGLNLNERMSRNVYEAFELDSNGDFQPTPSTGYMVDPKWELDSDGNLQRREREMWTFNWDDYFSD